VCAATFAQHWQSFGKARRFVSTDFPDVFFNNTLRFHIMTGSADCHDLPHPIPYFTLAHFGVPLSLLPHFSVMN